MAETITRILVTDDEDSVREVASRALAGAGRDVQKARDGREALDILLGSPIDLLITDIKMPRMSGDELVREARKVRPEIQIIMMTGFPELDTAREAIRQGVYEYLMKPYDLEDLKSAAFRALEVQRLSRENKAYQAELESRYLKLMEFERTRNNLIGLVAEDLRGPLAKAAMNLEILGDNLAGDMSPDQSKLVALTRESVQRSLSVSSDLADLRLAEQDDLFVARGDVSLGDLLASKLERVNPAAREEKKEVLLTLEGSPRVFQGDEGLLSRLLDNALIFSLRHTASGGKVNVRLKTTPSEMEAVFEGGDRDVPSALGGTALARLLASEPGNLGLEVGEALGLAFCWNAVEAHRGKASFERPEPGKSVLRFSLPAGKGN